MIELRCESELRYVYTALSIVGVGPDEDEARDRALRQFVGIPPQVFARQAWEDAERNHSCQAGSNCEINITLGRMTFSITNRHPYTPSTVAVWVSLQIPVTVACQVDPHDIVADEILAGQPWWPTAIGDVIDDNVIQACGYQVEELLPSSWSSKPKEGD